VEYTTSMADEEIIPRLSTLLCGATIRNKICLFECVERANRIVDLFAGTKRIE
jgi:hypothetical protein